MKRPPSALLLLAAAPALAADDGAGALLARGRELRLRALDALDAPAAPAAPSPGITVDEAVDRARRLRAAHARGEAVPATEAAPATEAVESDEAARRRQVRSLLVAGQELMAEMEALHRSLAGLQDLIEAAEIPAEDEIVSRTVKLVRRVRSLVHASHAADPEAATLRRRDRRARRIEERKMLRAGGIGSGEVERVMENQDAALVPAGRKLDQQPGMEDYVTRKLADTTITFPECKELFLEDCIDVLNAQMVELAMDLDIVIHEKRAQHQEGYHKVVLVTDLTGTYVKGKLHDGMVDYPFLWEDSVTGYAHQLGVNGQWDCHAQSPEECCAQIKASCPNPDVRGNMIACHIFVPYGGVGNKKTDERVFVNLSPDGRVQEAPYVA